MGKYAVLDNANRVINIILTEDKDQSEIDIGLKLVDADSANGAVFGWIWDGNSFLPPTPPAAMLEEISGETPTE